MQNARERQSPLCSVHSNSVRRWPSILGVAALSAATVALLALGLTVLLYLRQSLQTALSVGSSSSSSPLPAFVSDWFSYLSPTTSSPSCSSSATTSSRAACGLPVDILSSIPSVWTNASLQGSQYVSPDSACPFEPLIDYFIGTECGGLPDLNYSDLSAVSFLKGRAVMLMGDSIDRYALRFLCGIQCPPEVKNGCPTSCSHAGQFMEGEYAHLVYPMFAAETAVHEGFTGLSVCFFPPLNFTIMHAMTYGISERAMNRSNRADIPFPGAGLTMPQFLTEQLRPFFSHNASQHIMLQSHTANKTGQPQPVGVVRTRDGADKLAIVHSKLVDGVLPFPSLIAGQGGLWDFLTANYHHVTHDEMIVNDYQHQLRDVYIPSLLDTFPTATVYTDDASTDKHSQVDGETIFLFRTLPPAGDFPWQSVLAMGHVVRQVVTDWKHGGVNHTRAGQRRNGSKLQYGGVDTLDSTKLQVPADDAPRLGLIDLAVMLSQRNYNWDTHHPTPAVMYQYLNVAFNSWKQKLFPNAPIM